MEMREITITLLVPIYTTTIEMVCYDMETEASEDLDLYVLYLSKNKKLYGQKDINN